MILSNSLNFCIIILYYNRQDLLFEPKNVENGLVETYRTYLDLPYGTTLKA